METVGRIQLGKQGVTDNFITNLKNVFKKNKNVKVSFLKSAHEGDRKKMKEISEDILNRLGTNYTGKVIGFTLALKKWRKPMRESL
jgi:RNA-binding protein YhbY